MKKSFSKFSRKLLKAVAKLSNLRVKTDEEVYLTSQFEETLQTIDVLNKIDTTNVAETDQVTGTENILREDKVNKDQMLTQEEALSNAKQTHKGYFIVKAVFDEQ